MERYILRYQGSGPKPEEDVEHLRKMQNVNLLDDSPRMVLVEGQEDELQHFVANTPKWIIIPEKMLSVPDPVPTPRQYKSEQPRQDKSEEPQRRNKRSKAYRVPKEPRSRGIS
ncbi:MAG: hypothetical protein M3328_03020 [Chloroflexota bacterium]|nr:hypothetical protein [Chloroflexota bacterium]